MRPGARLFPDRYHRFKMIDDHHGEVGAPVDTGNPDDLELTTVGIDIGSATSHLMFSRLQLRRLGKHLSSRYLVIRRETLYRSPILLTPFADDSAIDAAGLREFVFGSFHNAGLTPGVVDTGAVILTGEAMKRSNARAIADLFAGEAGKFVCATAGHSLEAVVAAHGSGAVETSRLARQTILNVDVGGGTSKLALIRNGVILETAAINVGGRLVALDQEGRVVRIEPAARQVAEVAGIELRPQKVFNQPDQRRMAGELAACLLAALRREPLPPLAAQLMLTAPLSSTQSIDRVMFSGGVSEYVYQREERDFGDIARLLAEAIRDRQAALPAPLEPAGEGIRATVIGASQFTVQVSGDTILVSQPERLPLRNLPVLALELDRRETVTAGEVRAAIERGFLRYDRSEGDQPVALAIDWNGTPSYQVLRALADGIVQGLPKSLEAGHPIVLVFSSDFGKVIGEILRQELGVRNDVVSVDSIELRDFDYIDIGDVISPARVVPVVVKSLLFGPAAHQAAGASGRQRVAAAGSEGGNV